MRLNMLNWLMGQLRSAASGMLVYTANIWLSGREA